MGGNVFINGASIICMVVCCGRREIHRPFYTQNTRRYSEMEKKVKFGAFVSDAGKAAKDLFDKSKDFAIQVMMMVSLTLRMSLRWPKPWKM